MKQGFQTFFLLVLAGCSAGCAIVHQLTGPKWSPRAEPVGLTGRIQDHTTKSLVRILVFGDAGTGKREQHLVADGMIEACAAAGGCDLALVLGDNIYPAGVEPLTGTRVDRKFATRFERPYLHFGRFDMWAVPGNHDWYKRHSVQAEIEYSTLSERWRMPAHDYEIPGLPDWLHVYGLDTTPLASPARAEKLDRLGHLDQLARAEEALCDRSGWRLLFGHHPLYSSGRHSDRRGRNVAIGRRIGPLIEDCGIQLYFSGHEHHQEHLRAPLFDQIVQGAAGKLRTPRRIEDRADGVQPISDAVEQHGFSLVEAQPEELIVRFFRCDGATCEAFHCERYALDRFFGRGPRSETCALEQALPGAEP